MNKSGVVTLEEIENLRKSLWQAYEVFGSWRPVGEQLLGKSKAYAWKVAQGLMEPSPETVYYWREFWLDLRIPWKTNPDLMKAAWEEIKDRWGPGLAISVPILAKRLKIGPRKARATVRALKKEGYPVCTTLSRTRPGYFRPRDLEEYRTWRRRTQLNRAYDILESERAQKTKEEFWFPSKIVQSPLPLEELQPELIPS